MYGVYPRGFSVGKEAHDTPSIEDRLSLQELGQGAAEFVYRLEPVHTGS